MLSVRIIAVGRDKESWISDHIKHYSKMINKYAQIETITIGEEKYNSNTDIPKAIKKEAGKILSRHKGGFQIALDVSGESLSTGQMAKKFISLQNNGVSQLEFIIGGPFGLDKELIKEADYCLSMSTLTMSHQIVRLVLLEQLYRVLNLNAGGHYHK